MLTIDGSNGEGGGQILRTALGLSMLTGTPFGIERIRANRSKPGLMRQHRAAVLAAAEVCGANVEGADVSSTKLTFDPGPVKPGEYAFNIGSAGSTTLLVQAVLPALLTADGPSRLSLTGGTHNPFAPPVDFLERSFLAQVNRMGPIVNVALDRHGFYPAGGGQWTVDVTPGRSLSPLHIETHGEITGRACKVLVAALPGDIGVRELDVCRKSFDWPEEAFRIEQLPEKCGPGNAMMIELAYANVTEICTSFGERGTRAEAVAQRCIDEAKRYLSGGAPVGEHLADQLLVPMAMAGGGSFVTSGLSLHARTNIETIGMFLNVPVRVEEHDSGRVRVAAGG